MHLSTIIFMMSFKFSAARLARFACFYLASAFTYSSVLASPVDDGIVLRPVHADVFERSTGIQVRSDVDFSRLSLSDQVHMVYGQHVG